VANQAAIERQDGNLQAEAPLCQRIRIDVAHLETGAEIRKLPLQIGDEVVAERTIRAAVDDELRARPRDRRCAQGRGSATAGRRPVAMYLSVSGGTSPTAVIW